MTDPTNHDFIEIKKQNGDICSVRVNDITKVAINKPYRCYMVNFCSVYKRKPVPAVNWIKVLYLKLLGKPIPWKFESGPRQPAEIIITHKHSNNGSFKTSILFKNYQNALDVYENIVEKIDTDRWE